MAENISVGYVTIYPFKGGLETISIPGVQTPGSVVNGSNFIIDVNGVKKKHPGTIRQDDETSITAILGSTLTGNTRGLFDHWRLSGNAKVQRTVLISGGKIMADNGDGIYVDVTGSNTINPLDSVSMETFVGLLVMGFDNNPSNTPLAFDHSTVNALGGTPPNAKYFRTWVNRMWASGVSTAPDRLYYSASDDPEDWTLLGGGGSVNIDQGDQDPVGFTSIFPPTFGRMIVGKRRSLYEITPVSTTFAVRPLIVGLGCISHGGVATVDNDQVFPSERGIHSLAMTDKFGEVETGFLSYPIQDWYQDNIDFKRGSNMKSLYISELNTYLLAATIRGSSRNNVLLGYNMVLKEWWKADENVASLTRYVDPKDGLKTKVLIADDVGRVGILDTNKNGRTVKWFGEDRTSQFTTGLIYPLGVNKEVTFSKLKLFMKPQTANSNMTVSYNVNGVFQEDLNFSMSPIVGQSKIGSAVIGVNTIGNQGKLKVVTKEIQGNGENIELIFTHTPTDDNEDFEIYGLVIRYEFSGKSDKTKTQ